MGERAEQLGKIWDSLPEKDLGDLEGDERDELFDLLRSTPFQKALRAISSTVTAQIDHEGRKLHTTMEDLLHHAQKVGEFRGFELFLAQLAALTETDNG